MNLEQVHRDLGRLEGQVTALQSKVDEMDTKLDKALAALNHARGFGAAASAGVSAVVAFATAWFLR